MPHATYATNNYSYPPFPSNIEAAKLHKISLRKLSENDAKESNALFNACTTVGFFCLDLRNDIVGQELLAHVQPIFELGKDIFDLSLEEKKAYAFSPGKSLIGYKASGVTKVDSKGSLDRCEFWSISKDEVLSPVDTLPSPACIQEQRPALRNFILSSHSIVEVISNCLDLQLQLPLGTLVSKQKLEELSGSNVRVCKTMPQPVGDRRTSLVAHTDIGAITILFNILGGLQILPPEGNREVEADWRFVKPETGCAIINMGDAMVQWSNGILRSNMHRVTFPPGVQADFTRYSVVYFSRATADTIMVPLSGSRLIKSFERTGMVDSIAQDDNGKPFTASEWENRKGLALRQGLNVPQSLGGSSLKRF